MGIRFKTYYHHQYNLKLDILYIYTHIYHEINHVFQNAKVISEWLDYKSFLNFYFIIFSKFSAIGLYYFYTQ